ncbi:hypothetical protein [Prevotella sp. AGR2160]|uniref:hypothetical protein n=1 Tax=Prevotella sp. AGR2160 TaxID=1280674 RepID=UPI000411E491|nr:hypothetical protein [Prevotella sp. AGR2160]
MKKPRNLNTPQNKHALTDKQIYTLVSRDVHWLLEAPHDEAYYWKDTIVALVEIGPKGDCPWRADAAA